MKNRLLLVVFFAFSFVAQAGAALSNSPKEAKAYIISPADGAVVKETFKVVFGLSNMGVAPAGTMQKNTGHHHLLIDMDSLPDLTKPLVKNAQLMHFGGGQTEALITLPKGQHTLQLVLGDYAHTPHKIPVVSEKVTITVE